MTNPKSLALALSLMLVFIMGTMSWSFASHALQHTNHHTPATHGTGICSWMCAAAQTISGDGHVIFYSFPLIVLIEWMFFEFPSFFSVSFLPTRAPPL